MLSIFIPIYIAITLGIGFWASTRIKTSKDFTLAGKSLSTSFVGVTIFATWFGSSYIMGNPSHFVENGVSGFIIFGFSNTICLFFVGYFFSKRLYRMNIVTVGDFFQIRYSKKMESTISLIMVFTYFYWIAAQFVALAFLFENIFGIPMDMGILISALIVVIYTYVGGMWAVSYTDMLQSILIIIGLVFLLVNVLGQTGGLAPIFAEKPDSFFSVFPANNLEDWSEYLAVLLAMTIGVIPAQEIYQRVFSAKSEKSAEYGSYLAGILLAVFAAVPMIIALGAAHLHPELMEIEGGQSIIPTIVTEYANLPIQVLFFGALISAILSTSSGAILAPATIIGENLLKPYLPGMNDKKLLLWTRLSVILIAALSCYFALIDADITGLVVASISLLMVCIATPFIFGLFWKRASLFGAWASIIVGGVVWLICVLLETKIDATIYGLIASILAMVLGSFWKPDHK